MKKFAPGADAPRLAVAVDAPRLAASPASGYVVLCAASLGVLVLVQLRSGQNPLLIFLTAVVGVLGIVLKMPLAPLIVMVWVAFCQMMQHYLVFGRFEQEPGQAFRTSNVLMCAAVLGYVVGHYRLQGLVQFVLPPDERLKQRGRIRRSVSLVVPAEPAVLASSLLLWALAAQMAWRWLAQVHPQDVLNWPLPYVRLAVFFLILVPSWTVAAALLRYVRRRRMMPEEAMLLLQDTLWNETRGEQRWFARWLARMWLRSKEKE